MTKKIRIQLSGQTFELPSNSLRVDKWDNTQYIYMSAKNTASVIKQFVKKNFPGVKVWATSDVYSGGSSVRVNVCNSDGSPLSLPIFSQIHSFGTSFKAGRYDGMTDCYEYSDAEVRTDSGTQLKYFPSYIFIENKATWGSVEYWVNEIKNEGRTLEQELTYMNKSVVTKVIQQLSL
jgi:hypothetical protein